MSPTERPVPPVGEELHIPEGSVHPVLLALFITVALVGVTFSVYLVILGGIGALWIIVRWVADARRDIAELPADHGEH